MHHGIAPHATNEFELNPAGLGTGDVAERLRVDGHNELPRRNRRNPARIAIGVLREPMFGLLVAAGIVYLLLGDLVESVALIVFASLSIVITITQEIRSERVLEALRELSVPLVRVIRDGAHQQVPSRELVTGDVVLLGEGDRVPADGRIVSANDIQFDESMLTGESVPVSKIAPTHADASATPERHVAYSGTLVVRGEGLIVVTSTGIRTELGKIGTALGTIESATPRLTTELRGWVIGFARVGITVSVLVTVLYGTLRGTWLDALLAGIATSMAMLPEEFPLVLTVFMVMGAWRLSRQRVLTRRASAIETLGAATVLCCDKTGTLTENRMRIAELRAGGTRWSANSEAALPAEFRHVVDCGVLASARDPFDPMEKAFVAQRARSASGPTDELPPEGDLQRVYGLRPDLLATTYVWPGHAHGERRIVSKGAPEAIAGLCGLADSALAAARNDVDDMARVGLRVLAVAEAFWSGHVLPESPRGFAFRLVGLVGLEDPLRASVPAAIAQCQAAGIRIVMITGDHPITARAIAAQAGLRNDVALSGDAIERMDERELAQNVAGTSIFARIKPLQKLRIVQAFQANGDVVAMTGDGVNDAPSLKAADIGVAMGKRGTDVAREAASIILLDDDFAAIPVAVRLGRRIYDNLRKAVVFILAVHVPIAGLALLPLLVGWPVILSPIHIAFLEMVIDPTCSIAFESEHEEDDLMRRPPRPRTERMFAMPLVVWGVFQGVLALTIVIAIHVFARARGFPEAELRATTFATLVACNFAMILANRSFGTGLHAAFRRNGPLVIVLGSALAVLVMTMTVAPVQDLFRFALPPPIALTWCAGACVAMFAGCQLFKHHFGFSIAPVSSANAPKHS